MSHQKQVTKLKHIKKILKSFTNTFFIFKDFSVQTAHSNVKTYPLCTIDTADPSIKLSFVLQV